jgi:DNA-binding transcriptional LysR family regulator
VQVNVSSTSTIIDWVLNGQTDLGLVKGPITHKGVKATPLFSSPIIPIFHRSHPFAEKAVLTPKDFTGHKLILPSEQTIEWEQIIAWLENHKIELQERIEVDHVETMKQFVFNNLGITFSSVITVHEELNSRKLRTAAMVPPLQIAQEAFVVTHRSLPLSDKAAQFWEFLLKEEPDSERRAYGYAAVGHLHEYR